MNEEALNQFIKALLVKVLCVLHSSAELLHYTIKYISSNKLAGTMLADYIINAALVA